jgi:ferric-dicitrate binding protein FerR (iron transport regulator)
MEYVDYSLEHFLADEYFQQWVLDPQQDSTRFWESWLLLHPDRQALVEQARQLILYMASQQQEEALGDSQQEALWQRIQKSRRLKEPVYGSTVSSRFSKQAYARQIYRLAAVFIGFVLCSMAVLFFLYSNDNSLQQHSTAYGQIKTLRLPDGSVVTLNANSIIRYAPDWKENQPREVWLEGEAFFSVVHTSNHQKFQVRTASQMAVEVLGTEFNVKSRTSGTQVVLNSGKVKLSIGEQATPQQIMMVPGESVELAGSQAGYVKKVVDPQQYSSWTQRKLIFKNTPVGYIKSLLEDTYGLAVVVPDSNLLEQQISGSVPSDDLDGLLFALQESFNYKIIRKDKQIILEEKTAK